MTEDRASPSVPALDRALDVLDLYLHDNSPRSIPELSRELSIPKSSTHLIVKTLVARGYLESATGAGPQRFRPGLRLFQLGSIYSAGLELATLAQQVSLETASLCDETIHVAILDQRDVIYIAKVDTSKAVRLVSRVGGRLPAHCTACGKALLAQLQEPEIRALYEGQPSLPRLTPRSIASLDVLLDELRDVRSHGLAHEEGESNPDAACIAAPVYDSSGAAVASLSMTVPMARWGALSRADRERVVLDAAQRLSGALGFRQNTDPG